MLSGKRRIILVGAGHAHLYVAARAEAFAQRGCRVSLIDPGAFWYSGLATGMLGGMYQPADDQLDPQKLVEAKGGELIRDQVTAVDTRARCLYLANGGMESYDYLSLNVGSRVNRQAIAGADDDPTVWTVKPISQLWKLRQHLSACLRAGRSPQVAVVGGGPSGCEVAANLLALAARYKRHLPVTLITGGKRLIRSAPSGAARALHKKLSARGLKIQTGCRIAAREENFLLTDQGGRIPADIVVLAPGLEANRLVFETGLPNHPKDGLRVNARLQSIADERVFAAGDCASLEGFSLPKLGVFGVRQARFVHSNLLASLDDKALQDYRPQKHYLSILNLGDGTALSTWGPLWWNGRSSMWLKHSLDKRFLEGYR